jgi:pimeloyl-ACP methyl ester carboxylesterase
VDDLVRVLRALGVPERRVVVGHSYGALLALDHALRHGGDVIGVVLVDPMNPAFVEATGEFVQTTVPHIASPANDREHAIARLVSSFDRALAAAIQAEPRVSVPIVVLSAGVDWWGPDDVEAAWRASHRSLVAGWPQRRLVVADGSDHDVPARRPELVVEAVHALVD